MSTTYSWYCLYHSSSSRSSTRMHEKRYYHTLYTPPSIVTKSSQVSEKTVNKLLRTLRRCALLTTRKKKKEHHGIIRSLSPLATFFLSAAKLKLVAGAQHIIIPNIPPSPSPHRSQKGGCSALNVSKIISIIK